MDIQHQLVQIRKNVKSGLVQIQLFFKSGPTQKMYFQQQPVQIHKKSNLDQSRFQFWNSFLPGDHLTGTSLPGLMSYHIAKVCPMLEYPRTAHQMLLYLSLIRIDNQKKLNIAKLKLSQPYFHLIQPPTQPPTNHPPNRESSETERDFKYFN